MLILVFLFLSDTEYLKDTLEKSLVFTLKYLVPVLFPFAVITRILCVCGGLTYFPFVTYMISKLFSVSKTGASAVFFGLFSGFPMGAFASSSLIEESKISESEGERIALFANNAGVPFIFGALRRLYGLRISVYIYISQTLSSVILSFLLRRKTKDVKETPTCAKFTMDVISGSIEKSALSMVFLFGYGAFFSCVCGYFSKLLALMNIKNGALFSMIFSSFVEVGNTFSFSRLLDLKASVIPMVFSIGFGGLSVHLQTLSLFKSKLSLKKIFFSRLFHALMTVFIFILLSFI